MLFVLNLLFYSNFVSAQDIAIEGKIIARDSKEPLSYSTIEIKSLKTGTYSNEKGEFSITIPEKNDQDTILVSSLGFEKKIVKISELKIPGINYIELNNNIISLKEVIVKPVNTKTFVLGPTDKKPWQCQVANLIGGQYGRYFENKKRKQGIAFDF